MPRLLWIDDEGERKFLFEAYKLRQEGWIVEWAVTVEEATAALSTQPYDAVLLDQMMPLGGDGSHHVDVWTGCLVLWWLRRGHPPEAAPPLSIEASRVLWTTKALEENRRVPAICVSAFDDDEVMPVMQDAADDGSLEVPMMVKPIRFPDLLAALSAVGDAQ